jgi:cbb3-type cytochrome oxidase subunit 1
MNKLAGNFMKAAVLYALIGFTAGVVMGATHDFQFRSVHTHLNLIGWASMAIYAVFYQLVPEATRMGLARVHFWAANAGLIVLSVSVALISRNVEAAAPGAAAGSLITLVSLFLFTYIVFKSAGTQTQRG